MAQTTMTRRGFVKSAAALGAACGLGIAVADDLVKADPARAAASSEVKIVKTSCRACISNCAVLAHVKDGRVIKLEGNPDSPMNRGGICAKGLSGIQALYNPNRNKYPMKRVGERGGDDWERLSWDEALDQVCNKITEVTDKYGPEAITVSTGGGGNPHFSNVKRFGEAIGTPNVWEPGCAQCYLPRMGASQLAYGAGKPNNLAFADSTMSGTADVFWTDTKLQNFVLWGTDPSNSSPASGGRNMSELRARKEGIKTVVIDPRFTMDAAKADVWLPIRPGTDVALMLCWIRYIIDKKLYDAEFVTKWTNGPYLVNPKTRLTLKAAEAGLDGSDKDYVIWNADTKKPEVVKYPFNEGVNAALMGTFEVNGMQCSTGMQLLADAADRYTIDEAAKICWLDADQIQRAIDIYTEKGKVSSLCLGVATDQYAQSQQAALATLMLEFLMGHVEKPGSFLQKFKSSPVKDQIPNTPRLLDKATVLKRLGYAEHKGLGDWDMAFIPDVLKAMETGDPYQIHMWIERSGNKHVVMGGSTVLEKAVPNIDMVVHCFMYPTAFTRFCADMILPTTEWLETNLAIPQKNTIVVRQEVTHLFETVEEGIIWCNIAKRLAKAGNPHAILAFDADACGSSGAMYHNEIEKRAMHLGKLGISWEELCEKGVYEWCSEDEFRHYNTYLDDDGTGTPVGFGTVSKKLELYCEANTILGRTGYPWAKCREEAHLTMDPCGQDYEPVPYYEEPAESPLTDTEYPLVLTEGRLPMYHHGTLRNCPYVREIYPVPECWIHPDDAEKYGITDGEWVWLESRRGKTRGKAKVTKAIAKGVLYQERFWNPELLSTDHPEDAYRAMNINVLTKHDAPYNPEYGTYTLRGFTVKISPCPEGAPAGTWMNGTDFAPWMPQFSDSTPEVFANDEA